MSDNQLPQEQPPINQDDTPLGEWLTRLVILINGIFQNVYDAQIYEITHLRAVSPDTQSPTGTDAPMQIEFGAARGGTADIYALAADGSLTVRQEGQYDIEVLVHVQKETDSTAANLLFYFHVNDVQVGDTVLVQLDETAMALPVKFMEHFDFDGGDVLKVYMVRDSAGVDEGSLIAFDTTLGTIANVFSARIELKSRKLSPGLILNTSDASGGVTDPDIPVPPLPDIVVNNMTNQGSITRTDGPGDNFGVVFNPGDGTQMFILGINGVNEINEYTLTGAWDLTTAGASPVNTLIPSSAPGTSVNNICMSRDGNYIFTSGVNTDRVRRSALISGPWDISGGATAADVADVDLTADGVRPYGMDWNADGSVCYICDSINQGVHQIPCGTAWDLNSKGTIVFQSTAPNATFPEGIGITGDERYVLISDGSTVKLFEMTTPGDLTTLTYLHDSTGQSFPSAGAPRGVFVKPDDNATIYVGNQGNNVDQADPVLP